MTSTVPRLRLFAGPNGSGKSTIKALLAPELLGYYINPDEIQFALERRGNISLSDYGLSASTEQWHAFAQQSALLNQAQLVDAASLLAIEDNQMLSPVELGEKAAYLASVISDFIRRLLLEGRQSFSFESVMSSLDKVELLRHAQSLGYRTYLYYIATDAPEINISRVRARVELGGHDVPEDKIVTRYYRSLGLLVEAIRSTNRAYVFDNSGTSLVWIAEITEGKQLDSKVQQIPNWFVESVWSKLG